VTFQPMLNSFPLRDCVALRKNTVGVMLSGANISNFSVTCEDEILRLSPQDDITTQSLMRKKKMTGACCVDSPCYVKRSVSCTKKDNEENDCTQS
jgi:hypothetical protein